ncbi:MAG: hypothetical protein Q9212_001417 [Teloschistes hypoglaucus]
MAQLHPVCAQRDAWRLIKDLERAVLKRYRLDHSRYSKPGMVHMRTRFVNGEPNISAQCYTKDGEAAIAFWTGVAGHLLNGRPIYAAIFSSQQGGPPLYESKVPLNGMGPVELAHFHSIEPTLNALSSNTGGSKWKKETGGRRGFNADRFPERSSKQDRCALKFLEGKDHNQNAPKPQENEVDSGVQCSGDETSMEKIDQPIIIDSDD